ncbi:hypothetical protein PF005_g5732 [Phytophthora fragariae]|uniref:Secreted protein n=1 Tax=Phytophthora fragariae TaxID=53985 RepID=A0A6A3T0D7_9STRA|nr:hypothetical protein PF003_g31530 [Phytophthora fragariae]KAE8944024.1 hypothetical protein PF009_g6261 [Phytophthora fragariae]KAE9022496.1 hypothetical protein PF011_g4434 [Phytophthora fragariae]KAE9124208.1 hypothetical protein PF010_g6086 [Phytophthora fragariae]KAE9126749.1 hypothetical protein PF007_g5861 [Phytophthora fragariae]
MTHAFTCCFSLLLTPCDELTDPPGTVIERGLACEANLRQHLCHHARPSKTAALTLFGVQWSP